MDIARGPRGDHLRRKLGIGRSKNQVVCTIKRNKALGMEGRSENRRGILDSNGHVGWRMQNEQWAPEIANSFRLIMLFKIVDKVPA